MIQLDDKAVIVDGDALLSVDEAAARGIDAKQARNNTLAHRILAAHDTSTQQDGTLRLRFDALASHDITYVGIIQTARASGLERFPMPYALTNCHNSLCAVGGTINEDDHLFGLTAAQKYGGIFVPPHMAVIHQYAREMLAGCGKMILGSDSHTRYGALGTMAVGEGGPELVKQLLGKTYDVSAPEVVLVWLENTPQPGVGPQDVALAIIGAVFKNGFVKNRVMEFAGPGIDALSVEYRCGIDVMTTETTCLSSIWRTDARVRDYLALHGRADDYAELKLEAPACYDRLIRIDLAAVQPMIALPFHPSNAWPIAEFIRHADDLLGTVEEEARKQFGKAAEGLQLRAKIHDGGVWTDQGVIAGCAGGSFENCVLASAILDGQSTGNGAFSLSVYPASEPQSLALVRNGAAAKLMAAGAIIKNAFCGPCFGAGDTPAHGALSIRHSTRNFPNREGSKPGNGQASAVALMDARSIAATAANGGKLTPATDLDWTEARLQPDLTYDFDAKLYARRVYNGYNQPKPETELKLGPNITDWPRMSPLTEHLLLKVASVITDPVTTTDELIPSGETSSLRSNPLRLSEFTLSRKDPAYVGRAKATQALEKTRLENPADASLLDTVRTLCAALTNLINWGMLPLIADAALAQQLHEEDVLVLPHIRKAVAESQEQIQGWLLPADGSAARPLTFSLSGLTNDERQIILDGCLINFYNRH